MYITIFVCQVQKAALNLWSVFKTYLKALWSSCFRGSCRKKKFSAERFGLCIPWSFILRPPEHWFLIFPFYFKPQSSKSFWAPYFNWKNCLSTISDKIVDTFTFLTPYFVTVISFCPPSLSVRPRSSPNNVVPRLLWSWGITNKQHWMGSMVFFTIFSPWKEWC